MSLKGNAKEEHKALLHNPRLTQMEFLDLPMIIAKCIEEVKKGNEYEIVIT